MSIIVYSRSTPPCSYCTSAKSLLSQKGLAFEDRDIATNEEFKREFAAYGQSTVPLIVIDGQPIGGCDDLYALDAMGGL